jgi:anti-anti-sigma factor
VGEKPFKMSVRQESDEDKRAIVEVGGFLDAHTVVEFEDQMNGLLEQGASQVVIDLAELNYISSAGIGAMMGLVQRLRRQGGDMVLLRPNTKVQKILAMLGFTEIFKIAQSEDEALAELKN